MYLTSSHSKYGKSRQNVEYAGHSRKPESTSSCADIQAVPDSKVHGANMGPILGRQGPGGASCLPHEPCYLVCLVSWSRVPIEMTKGFITWECAQTYGPE